jgi:hypothetical protein
MDEAAQEVLRRYRVRNERKLYELVGRIACKRAGVDYPKQFEPMPLKAAELVPGIMRTVTSFKRGDGSVVAGVLRPELMRSDERVERSVEDARAWLGEGDEGGDAA